MEWNFKDIGFCPWLQKAPILKIRAVKTPLLHTQIKYYIPESLLFSTYTSKVQHKSAPDVKKQKKSCGSLQRCGLGMNERDERAKGASGAEEFFSVNKLKVNMMQIVWCHSVINKHW